MSEDPRRRTPRTDAVLADPGVAAAIERLGRERVKAVVGLVLDDDFETDAGGWAGRGDKFGTSHALRSSAKVAAIRLIIARDGWLVSVRSSPVAVSTWTPCSMSASIPSCCLTSSRAKRDASSPMTWGCHCLRCGQAGQSSPSP